MLLFNFLCVFYLMVFIDSHTISKSIADYNYFDKIPESISDFDYTRKKRRHDVFFHNYRREPTKSTAPVTDITTKFTTEFKNMATTSKKTINVLKTPKKKTRFWKKFRYRKTKKPKRRTRRLKHTFKSQSRITHRLNYDPTKNKRETPQTLYYKMASTYRKPNDFIRKNPATPNKLSNNKYYAVRPTNKNSMPKVHTEQSTARTLKDLSLVINDLKVKYGLDSKSIDRYKTLAVVDSTTQSYAEKAGYNLNKVESIINQLEEEPVETAEIEVLLNNIKNRAIQAISEQMPAVTDMLTNAATEVTFEADPVLAQFSDKKPTFTTALYDVYNINKREIATATKTNNVSNVTKISAAENMYLLARTVEDLLQDQLKQMYGSVMQKAGVANRLKVNQKQYRVSTSNKITHQTTNKYEHNVIERSLKDEAINLAQSIEDALQQQLKKMMHNVEKVGYNSGARLQDLAQNKNITTHNNINTVTKSSSHKSTHKNNDPQNINKRIVTERSIKENLYTTAQTLEDILQDNLKKAFKQVKQKVHKDYGNKLSTLKSTFAEIISNATASIHKLEKLTKPRQTRKIKNHKTKAIQIDTTPSLDDLEMINLYEQILSKTHEDNVMRMLMTTPQSENDNRLSKRNPGTKEMNYDESDDDVEEEEYQSPEEEKESLQQVNITDQNVTKSPDSSYEVLTNQLSYNEFVNGYKHYLNFQKEQAAQNFSNLVKFQAHLHHKVDDIGKFILDKIPQMPSRGRRFFDDTDIDDQDVSTKSDDSWLKKHFYMFIENGPPKKYHTSETVNFKNAAVTKKAEQRDLTVTWKEKFPEVSTNINVYDADVDIDNLTRELGSDKVKDADPNSASKMESKVPDESQDTGFSFKIVNNNLFGKLFGKPARNLNNVTELNDSNHKHNRTKRNSNKTQHRAMKQKSNDAKGHKKLQKKKDGYVTIDVVPQQTSVVNLRPKQSKFKKLLKKLHLIKKNKREVRRQKLNANSIFRGLKDMFKAKVIKSGHEFSDYEVVTSHLHKFTPVKYNNVPSVAQLAHEIPNITDDTPVAYKPFSKKEWEEQEVDLDLIPDFEAPDKIKNQNNPTYFNKPTPKYMHYTNKKTTQDIYPQEINIGYKVEDESTILRPNQFNEATSQTTYNYKMPVLSTKEKSTSKTQIKEVMKNAQQRLNKPLNADKSFTNNVYPTTNLMIEPIYEVIYDDNKADGEIGIKTDSNTPKSVTDMENELKDLDFKISNEGLFTKSATQKAKNMIRSKNADYDVLTVNSKKVIKISTDDDPSLSYHDDYYFVEPNKVSNISRADPKTSDLDEHGNDFGDLLLWHNDILHSDKALPTLNDFLMNFEKHKITTPDLKELQEELMDFHKILNEFKYDYKNVANKSEVSKGQDPKVLLKLQNWGTAKTKGTDNVNDFYRFLKNSKNNLRQTTSNYYTNDNSMNDNKHGIAKKSSFIHIGKKPKAPPKAVAKSNMVPEQSFNTPQPMSKEKFDSFLKENHIDVDSVTSPSSDTSNNIENTKLNEKYLPKFDKSIANISLYEPDDLIDYLDDEIDYLDSEINYMADDLSSKRVKKSENSLEIPNLDQTTNSGEAVEITIINFDDSNKKTLDTSALFKNINTMKATETTLKKENTNKLPTYFPKNDANGLAKGSINDSVTENHDVTPTMDPRLEIIGHRQFYSIRVKPTTAKETVTLAENTHQGLKRTRSYTESKDSLESRNIKVLELLPLLNKRNLSSKEGKNTMIRHKDEETKTTEETTKGVLNRKLRLTPRHEIGFQSSSTNFNESADSINDTSLATETNINFTTTEIIKPKRYAPEVFTAKNVAAIEVVIDLLKETENKEINNYSDTKTTSNLLTNTLQLAVASTADPLTTQSPSTNSMQLHIAIPYLQNKKRAVGVGKIRKIFSAKMSAPVDIEYSIHSIEETLTTTAFAITIPSGMYVLVDNKTSTLNLQNEDKNMRFSDLKSTFYPQNDNKVTLSKDFITALIAELVRLNALVRNSTEKTKRGATWERIKEFLGHDRVCTCKCRENNTMCHGCVVADAVIRDLLFEFQNLYKYMTDHCTELQTFFWMNPTGGKKLRDLVHRIDKSMNDYFKRVKGKCQGKTCKSFCSYINKRKIENIDSLIKHIQEINNKVKNISNDETFKDSNLEKLTDFETTDQRADNTMSKRVYSFDGVNVNIICDPNLSSNTESTYFTSEGPEITESYDFIDSQQTLNNIFYKKPNKKKSFLPFFMSKAPLNKRNSNDIETPLIADTGGSFWYDYLSKRNTGSVNYMSKPSEATSLPKPTFDNTKVKDLLFQMYSKLSTQLPNATRSGLLIKKDTNAFNVTINDSLIHNMNELMKILNEVYDIDVLNQDPKPDKKTTEYKKINDKKKLVTTSKAKIHNCKNKTDIEKKVDTAIKTPLNVSSTLKTIDNNNSVESKSLTTKPYTNTKIAITEKNMQSLCQSLKSATVNFINDFSKRYNAKFAKTKPDNNITKQRRKVNKSNATEIAKDNSDKESNVSNKHSNVKKLHKKIKTFKLKQKHKKPFKIESKTIGPTGGKPSTTVKESNFDSTPCCKPKKKNKGILRKFAKKIPKLTKNKEEVADLIFPWTLPIDETPQDLKKEKKKVFTQMQQALIGHVIISLYVIFLVFAVCMNFIFPTN